MVTDGRREVSVHIYLIYPCSVARRFTGNSCCADAYLGFLNGRDLRLVRRVRLVLRTDYLSLFVKVLWTSSKWWH